MRILRSEYHYVEYDVLIGTAGDLITRIVLRFEECHIGNSIIGMSQIRAGGSQSPGGGRALAICGPRGAFCPQDFPKKREKTPGGGPPPGPGPAGGANFGHARPKKGLIARRPGPSAGPANSGEKKWPFFTDPQPPASRSTL